MAVRFAVASTSWNTPSTWDNGAVPLPGDTVYPNGFSVTIDTDISVASLNNNISPVAIPNIATPAMTSNTQPNGTVISSNNSGTAYNAFNQDNIGTVFWSSGVNNTGWIGYTFSTGKVIKRYIIKQYSASGNNQPKTWTFEGSNDGFATAGVKLDEVLSYTTVANYTSVLLANTTAYTSYRLNVTATNTLNSNVLISELEMTENQTASPVYGTITGGSFTVPSSLSGIRNIEFTGAGIISNNAATVMTLAHTSGNTVNLKVTSGGYIFNQNSFTANSITPIMVISSSGIVNFNSNIWGGQTNNIYNSAGIVAINSNATVTVNGNIYASKGTNTTVINSHVFLISGNGAIFNVNGEIIASNFISQGYAIYITSTCTVNVIGNLTSNAGPCIFATSTVYLTIVGNISYTNASSVTPITLGGGSTVSLTGTLAAPPNAVGISTSGSGAITITGAMTGGTGGTNGACIVSTGTGAINIPTGTITNGTNAVAISAVSSSLVTVGNSPIINSNNFMAIYAPRIRFYTGAQVEWTFQTSTGGTKILRNADGSSGLPSYIHVKIGQPFGPNRDIIGACVIPPANAVGVGIPVSAITPVDDPVPVIVGTLQLTGEDLLNAISTSSNVVATRLKNVATVETTGDQLAAFNRI